MMKNGIEDKLFLNDKFWYDDVEPVVINDFLEKSIGKDFPKNNKKKMI